MLGDNGGAVILRGLESRRIANAGEVGQSPWTAWFLKMMAL
jgi:hypothetical protein